MTTHDTPESEHLLGLIRQQLGSAASSLAARRDHSSYGYTKASIRTSLDRAEGMLLAWSVITGRTSHLQAGLPECDEKQRLMLARIDLAGQK